MLLSATNKYRRLYPGIPGKALRFFKPITPATPGGPNTRTMLEFLNSLETPNADGNGSTIPGFQPTGEILDKLAQMGFLIKTQSGTSMGMGDRYMSIRPDDEIAQIADALEYKLFGVEAIYDDLKGSVLPIIYRDTNGSESIGSSFLGRHNIIYTAAHCIKGAVSLSIKGITAEQFANAEIYVTRNEALDLAIILFRDQILPDLKALSFNTGQILGDVLALGYPNVPGFTEMLAAEKAAISSRITATRGTIASNPTEIFARTELFLITAKVRGGFSGGPVIDSWGAAVGIVSRQPVSQDAEDRALWDRYDNLGYGVVIPTEEIDKFLKACRDNNEEYFERIDPASLGYVAFPLET